MGCSPSQHSDAVEPITLMPGAASHAQLLLQLGEGGSEQRVQFGDVAETMNDVGGGTGSAGSAKNPAHLQKVIFKGRQEIKQAQEKLNSSLTTPIADAEIRVLEKGTWLSEVKDMTRRFNTLPPIQQGNKVKKNAMAFTID